MPIKTFERTISGDGVDFIPENTTGMPLLKCDATLETACMDESSNSSHHSASSSPILVATPLQQQPQAAVAWSQRTGASGSMLDDLTLQIQVAEQTAAEMAQVVDYWTNSSTTCSPPPPPPRSPLSTISSLSSPPLFCLHPVPASSLHVKSTHSTTLRRRRRQGLSSSSSSSSPEDGINLGMEISLNNFHNPEEKDGHGNEPATNLPLTPTEPTPLLLPFSETTLSPLTTVSGANADDEVTLKYPLSNDGKGNNNYDNHIPSHDIHSKQQPIAPVLESPPPWLPLDDDHDDQDEADLRSAAWQQKLETDALLSRLEQVEMDACLLRLTTRTSGQHHHPPRPFDDKDARHWTTPVFDERLLGRKKNPWTRFEIVLVVGGTTIMIMVLLVMVVPRIVFLLVPVATDQLLLCLSDDDGIRSTIHVKKAAAQHPPNTAVVGSSPPQRHVERNPNGECIVYSR